MINDLASMRSKLFDSVVRMVPTARWHERADDGGSTITGLLLHLARHQDLAVNTVIRNHEPLFTEHRAALGLADLGPAVGLAEREDRKATALVEPMPLQEYVTAVFDRTAEWLEPSTLALDDQGVLTCAVKAGRARARFSRQAHLQLAECLEPAADGTLSLRVGEALVATPLPAP